MPWQSLWYAEDERKELRMGMLQLSDTEFEQKVLQSQELIIVDFWAPWCAPCKMISPILKGLAEEYGNKIKVYKINIDEHRQTATKYQILSIPTLLFFKAGKIAGQVTGMRSASDIKKTIDSLL